MRNDRVTVLYGVMSISVFGLLGLLSLIGVCMGAWWHLFTLTVCAVMVFANVCELKRNKRRESGRSPGYGR